MARPNRPRPPRRNQRPVDFANQGVPGAQGQYANFPAPQEAPPSFLPMTPQFEAGRRGLDDQYQAQRMGLLNQQSMIDPLHQQQVARLQTNQGYDVNRLNEAMVERGIYDSGVRPQLQTRDIDIPYGRQYSDLGTAAAGQHADIAGQLSGADLAYNQGMAELLLNRAADAASNIPMNVPQWSPGGRVLRGKKYNNKPVKTKPKPPKKKPPRRNDRG